MAFVFSKKGSVRGFSGFGHDPRQDWRRVFFGFIFLSVLLLALNIYVYQRIDKGDIFLADEVVTAGSGSLSREKLQKTVQFFEDKKEKFNSIRANPPRRPDPSL